MTRISAFTDDALGSDDAVGLVQRLRAEEVSALELVDAAIARVEAVDPALHAVAYADWERARAEAARPRGGFFSGVPTFVKDNVDVQGMPTQQGSDAWTARPQRADGDFARMYLGTGLVALGKTQLSEFGFSPSSEHSRLEAVRSPWHTDRIAGASSAGSAALVAAGAVPIAHANDGGGSIRIPAAVNGLVGLKPTRGRLPQDKALREMPVQIVQDGVLTRSVRDTAALFREAEKIWRNPSLPPIGDVTRPLSGALRVAVATEGIGRAAHPDVRERTLETAALLESLGHQVTELDAPPVPGSLKDDFLAYWALLAMVILKTGRRQLDPAFDLARIDGFTHGLSRMAVRSLPRLPLAIARLRASRRRSAKFFGEYDVVLTPTLAHATPLLGHLDPTQDFDVVLDRVLDWVAFTPLQNATGEPAISLPLATSPDGLPLGMMLAAGQGQEERLLQLAYQLEEARPWPSIGPLIDAESSVGERA
jgi:amidase